jgi:hypothetical protein
MHCLSGEIRGKVVKDIVFNMKVKGKTSMWEPEYKGK